jgi:hypothetical protein
MGMADGGWRPAVCGLVCGITAPTLACSRKTQAGFFTEPGTSSPLLEATRPEFLSCLASLAKNLKQRTRLMPAYPEPQHTASP